MYIIKFSCFFYRFSFFFSDSSYPLSLHCTPHSTEHSRAFFPSPLLFFTFLFFLPYPVPLFFFILLLSLTSSFLILLLLSPLFPLTIVFISRTLSVPSFSSRLSPSSSFPLPYFFLFLLLVLTSHHRLHFPYPSSSSSFF